MCSYAGLDLRTTSDYLYNILLNVTQQLLRSKVTNMFLTSRPENHGRLVCALLGVVDIIAALREALSKYGLQSFILFFC
jgi:hypothetical protein